MAFANREEAAQKLAERLSPYKGMAPLVLAIPRGAVPMGKIIADALGGALDVVLVRKLGAPGNPEYAIGSVDESGHVTLNPEAEGVADEEYLKQEVRTQMDTMRKRRAFYTPIRAPVDPKDRAVIVVDDGIATGSTMLAALHAIREKKPKKLVVAIGVAPQESIKRLERVADEVICLQTPAWFMAVGQFFDEFPQVEDEEVIRILKT
ncbi:phosphoribosyltransferase [Candidatus Peregrinibacteria bacterium]|nr:phosphoribosyltransferase [Candidatus Peregrinibacteria bacterium]